MSGTSIQITFPDFSVMSVLRNICLNNIYIAKMIHKNASFIDILNNEANKQLGEIVETGDDNNKQRLAFLNSLPRYQSQDIFTQPPRKLMQEHHPPPARLHAHSLYVVSEKAKQLEHPPHPPSCLQTERAGRNDHRVDKIRKMDRSTNYNVRNDELVFQLKLKLVSFMKKFNVDGSSTLSTALSEMRDHSIESVLEQVFKKFKQYSKEHESFQKMHTESMKLKQIQNIKLQTQILTLEEALYEESNRSGRVKEKHREECVHMQQCLLQRGVEVEELRQSLYVAESIIKEQSEYIKEMETAMQLNEGNNELKQQIESLRSNLEGNNQKNIKLMRELQQLDQQNGELKQQIASLNQEINSIMEQNKQYKYEAMVSRQQYEKSVIELEQNEEKLITYFEMYNKERQDLEDLRQRHNAIQTQNKESSAMVQNLRSKIRELLIQKQANLMAQESMKKERDLWMNEVKTKQGDIIKLSKNLEEAISTYKSTYKNRPALKKAKTQCNDHNQSDGYTIIISPTKCQKEKRRSEEEHQEQIKSVVEQWRCQMLNTVDSYEKIVQNLEEEAQRRQSLIKQLQFEKAGMQSSNASTALQY